jgi:hypothetical protein
MNKTQAIQWAKQRGWTQADAKRAFDLLDFRQDPDLETLVTALVKFAGPELKKRQSLQAAQLGQVTKKKKLIIQIEANHASQIQQQEAEFAMERSRWFELIAGVYSFANRFGLRDPIIEDLIERYNHQTQSQRNAA